MYVDVILNRHLVRPMLDIGVTNNFMTKKMVLALVLKVAKSLSQIKAINSRA